jgi:hypothetical protein
MTIEQMIEATIGREGGYSNNPANSGKVPRAQPDCFGGSFMRSRQNDP